MRGNSMVLLIFVLIGLLCSSQAEAGSVCVLDPGSQAHDLKPFMEFLEDPGGRLTIEDVASESMASRFRRPSTGHFNFGFTSSALWFRFTVVEPLPPGQAFDAQRAFWIFDPGWHLYDTFHLFVPQTTAPGGWKEYSAGRLIHGPGHREHRHFQLPSDLTTPTTCYVRVTGIRSVVLNPYISTIDHAMHSNGFKMLGTSLLLGFFGTLMLANLGILLYTRNLKFGGFVLANAAFTVFVAVSSYQFLFIHERLPTFIMVAGLFSQGALAMVARAFLETRKGERLIDGLLLTSIWLVFAAAALAFFLPDQVQGKLSLYVLTPLSLVMIWACLANLKRDRTVSLIFLSAWVVGSANIFVYTWASQGILPFVHPAMIWIGLVVLAMAMAVLMAHDIRVMAARRQSAVAMARARSTFLASMSHEIRTPMTAILGFLNLSLQAGAEGQLRSYLLKVRSAAQHLMGVINDILDVAKIEAGKIELESKVFDPETLLADTAALITSQAFENGNELVLSLGPSVPGCLVGDSLRLQQILLNLGGNAAKFTKNGTVCMVVDVADGGEPMKDSVWLRFQVVDTGIGIDPEVLPRLFQSFEQADSSTARVYGGTGLGLNISQRLAHLMGSEINVQSALGRGSTFEFTVKFERVAGDEKSQEKVHAFDGLRTLLVEDNPASRAAMEEILGRLGVDVKSAATASDALRLLASESFDLVLLDLDLPDYTGLEVLASLNEFKLGAKLKVVLMASLVRSEMDGMQPDLTGVREILMKPFTYLAVKDVLSRAVLGEAFVVDATCRAEKMPSHEAVRGLRVLLVEDNLFNQELISVILEQAEVEFDLAMDGREAVTRIMKDDTKFDVVLMDIQMPGMDGYEATRIIRSDKRFGSLPIIAMTANVMAEDRARCKEAGMDGHLNKPVDTDELFKTLAAWGRGSE